ncbi:hypothetical protein J1N35_005751 [Gossypium stocksii]|uniref:Aminotransferase-like plant mobile domain-containing protein n=1 Tax=Gossypium stocksii TaxID=47602 RepID=A0A9D3WEE0_9ROSI|nr:hypothetical protein J1N35_005751 [Gossypium stocksii]
MSHMLGGYKLDPTQISALMERWRLKTHIVHLLCGECIISLEDVALQLDLLVDRLVVTRSVIVPSKVDLCKAMLGKVLNRFDGGWISINWLEDNFDKLLEYPMEEVIEQFVQAFIMRLIWGTLMFSKAQNLVHVRWLLHLVHFTECGKLSWGSVVFFMLYKKLCRATVQNIISICGCLLLLQLWA